MFKSFFVVLVFLCQFRGYTLQYIEDDVLYEEYAISESNATNSLSISQNFNASNKSEAAETMERKPVVINMNGHNNYHIGKQIIYTCNEQKFEHLPDSRRDKNNTKNKYDTNKYTNDKNIILISQGYRIIPEIGAYKLYPHKMTWNRARQACMQEGGHLAIIDYESEKHVLVEMLEENNVDCAWLGVHNFFQEDEWSTVNGDPLSTKYIKWVTKGLKDWMWDNFGRIQHCVSLIKPGALNDEECSVLNKFFCEISV